MSVVCNTFIMLLVSATLAACAADFNVARRVPRNKTTNSAIEPGLTLAPADFSTPTVGTKLQWKNMSTSLTVTNTSREPEQKYKSSYSTEDGTIRNLYLFCTNCGNPSSVINIETYAKLFPLEVGKTINLQHTEKGSPTISWAHKITVKKTELVGVSFRASPLQTYVIEENISNNYSDWIGKVTYWYAPSISADIKIVEETTSNHSSKVVSHELMSYSLPTKSVAPLSSPQSTKIEDNALQVGDNLTEQNSNI